MITVRTVVAAFMAGTLGISSVALAQAEKEGVEAVARAPQIDEQAREVVTRSADAIKNMKDFSATARRYATGPIVGGLVDIGGEFRLIKGPTAFTSPGFFKGRASNKQNPNDDVFHFHVQDNTVVWVDDVAKTVFVRSLQARTESMNQVTLGHQLLMEEFFKPEPYKRELESEALTVEGIEDFGGEQCYVVRASFREGESWHLWHISREDYLPRRMEMAVKLPDQEDPIRMILEYTSGRSNQNVIRQDLAIATPEGYQRNEQVAATPAAGADGATAAANVPPPPKLGPGTGRPAPAFDLASATGERVSLESLRGNVVVLGFGGTWNTPFTRALPVLQDLHTAFKDRAVKVFAATCREKEDASPGSFMSERDFHFGVLLQADEVAKQYAVRGFPAFAVIDAEGNVAHFQQGSPGEQPLREALTLAVRKALGESVE